MFGHDDQQQPATDTATAAPADTTTPAEGNSAAAVDQATAPFLAEHEPGSTPLPSTPAAATAAPAASDDLLTIKQQALKQLTPLVDHLDQSPEEKFRTTMMMIQAADDDTLIKTAYDAAQQITDEKTRAQALLDIVNEINYFTQHAAE